MHFKNTVPQNFNTWRQAWGEKTLENMYSTVHTSHGTYLYRFVPGHVHDLSIQKDPCCSYKTHNSARCMDFCQLKEIWSYCCSLNYKLLNHWFAHTQLWYGSPQTFCLPYFLYFIVCIIVRLGLSKENYQLSKSYWLLRDFCFVSTWEHNWTPAS